MTPEIDPQKALEIKNKLMLAFRTDVLTNFELVYRNLTLDQENPSLVTMMAFGVNPIQVCNDSLEDFLKEKKNLLAVALEKEQPTLF